MNPITEDYRPRESLERATAVLTRHLPPDLQLPTPYVTALLPSAFMPRRPVIDLTIDTNSAVANPEIIDVDAMPDNHISERQARVRSAASRRPMLPDASSSTRSYMYPALSSGRGHLLIRHDGAHGRIRGLVANRYGGGPIPVQSDAIAQILQSIRTGGHFQAPELDYSLHNSTVMNRAHYDAPVKYLPPRLPSEGFTRTFTEADLLVCPGCKTELGSSHTEEKRSIWFGTKCGHVYCGRCAHTFRKSKRGKGKGPSCSVKGCNSMFGSRPSLLEAFN